jgi:hypothetical protein
MGRRVKGRLRGGVLLLGMSCEFNIVLWHVIVIVVAIGLCITIK